MEYAVRDTGESLSWGGGVRIFGRRVREKCGRTNPPGYGPVHTVDFGNYAILPEGERQRMEDML